MSTIPIWTDDFYQAINPTTIFIGFHQAEPGWISEKKHVIQTDFDLWYVAQGNGAVKIDGCWHDFTRGELLTLRPGSVYQQEKTSYDHPFHVYYAHILPFGQGHPELTQALAAVWPLRMALHHRPDIGQLFRHFHDAFHAEPQSVSLVVKGLLMQILGLLLAEIRIARPTTAAHTDHRLARAKELIETAYQTELTLAHLAEQAGLSRGHFCTAFAQYAGYPPIEYLLHVRIREAQKLLTTGMPIKDVTEAVGCHSQHYFSRLFRRRTGMSPMEFAQRYGRKALT